MRKVPLADLKDDFSRFLREAEKQEIVITRHGKPAGVLVGFGSEDDWFDYRMENDPRFFSRIERARRSLRAGRGMRLEDIDKENASVVPTKTKELPAVSIKKSIQPDYLICLEDGKKLKMLKRHLRTAYNMTPEAYRERWGLPSDYPMVAPSYARQRSRLAKESGLRTTPRRSREKINPEAASDEGEEGC